MNARQLLCVAIVLTFARAALGQAGAPEINLRRTVVVDVIERTASNWTSKGNDVEIPFG